MSRLRLPLLGLFGAAVLAFFWGALPAATLPSRTDASGALQGAAGSTVLSRDQLPYIGWQKVVGRPAPGQVLHIGLGLRDRDPAGAQRLLGSVDDPRSPQYRHYLTGAQFADRFGPSSATYRSVLTWVHGGGLRVTQVSAGRDWIQATGTVAQVERLFQVRLNSYRTGGVSYFANATAPVVPARLGILAVVGLNNLQRFHTFVQDQPKRPSRSRLDAPQPPGKFQTGSLTPQQLWSIYDMPADNQGQGQTMAIFGAGRSDEATRNLAAFEQMEGLPPTALRTVYVGAGPFNDAGDPDDIEWSLDTQASTGMAPQTGQEDLYFGASLLDVDVEAVFNRWTDDNIDKQASASYGECESTPVDAAEQSLPVNFGNDLEAVAEQTLTRANLQGQTLFASTGDTGSFCPTVGLALNGVTWTGDPRLGYPAASPHAVAVGGTVLYGDGNSPAQRGYEYAWPYTGGGSSAFLAAGDYQKSTVLGRCAIGYDASAAAAGQPCRGVPDVAAESGDIATSAYQIYDDGSTTEGGTSLSSPLWLGIWTRIQAAAPDQSRANGFANPVLYRLGGQAEKYAHDFFDVQVGVNGLYTATQGWDYVSGWGAPDVKNLMLDVDGKTAPTNARVATATPAAPPAAGAITCGKLWTSSAHTITGPSGDAEPQLELLDGEMVLSDDATAIRVLLTVADLSEQSPAGSDGVTWEMIWTSAGTQYYAQAFLNATGSVSYSDGTIVAGQQSGANQDTGHLTDGRNGVVEIDVPVGNVAASIGTVLGQPAGRTNRFLGDPSGDGLNSQADTGGPTHDWLMAPQSTCTQVQGVRSSGPAAPAPAGAAPRPGGYSAGTVPAGRTAAAGSTSGSAAPAANRPPAQAVSLMTTRNPAAERAGAPAPTLPIGPLAGAAGAVLLAGLAGAVLLRRRG